MEPVTIIIGKIVIVELINQRRNRWSKLFNAGDLTELYKELYTPDTVMYKPEKEKVVGDGCHKASLTLVALSIAVPYLIEFVF